jgi:HlyD family secretion protein
VKRKKAILISFLLIAITAGLTTYVLSKREKPIAWRTASVTKGNINIIVTATGSINALTTVLVGTQVSGTISKLFVDFNSVVKKGEIIALLDTTFLAAAKDDAAAIVDKSQIQLKQATIEFKRQKKLFEEGAIPQSDYDLVLTNYESAQSVLKSAKAQLSRAKINLQYATIRAPKSGVVISRSVDVGQTVVASFNTPTLFSIANDLTKMQVYANIDEADIGQIKVGQKALFTVDAYPNQSFEGNIKQIRLQPTVIQNVVTYTVIIDVYNPDLKLMPGLTANINVNVREHRNILKIPSNGLHFSPPEEYLEKNKNNSSFKELSNSQKENIIEGDTTFIWIKKDNTIYPHKITVGLSDGSFTEVLGNIKINDEIVLGINKDPNTSSQTKNPFVPTFRPGSRRTTTR